MAIPMQIFAWVEPINTVWKSCELAETVMKKRLN